MGMHLARAEMRVAIERVLARMPALRIDPNATDAHIEGIVFRNPRVLPHRVGPAGFALNADVPPPAVGVQPERMPDDVLKLSVRVEKRMLRSL